MFPWLYLVLALLHATVLTVWIWRWRKNRVQAGLVKSQDQHAYCASCGYDLTGRDVDKIAEIEAVQCPECGQTIQTHRDAVIPKHIKDKMSHKTFALTIGMQVFFAAMALWFFYDDLGNPSPSHTTNTTLINTVTQQGGAATNVSDLYELDRRLDRGDLTQAEELKLLSLVLAYQADPTKPWEHMYGEWIEQGRAKGLVSDQQWRQYTNQPGFVWLTCREHIKPGDPLVLHFESDGRRLRTSLDYRHALYPAPVGDVTVAIFPEAAGQDAEPIFTRDQLPRNSYYGREFVPLVDGKPLPPGKYKAVVETELDWPDPRAQTPTPKPLTLSAAFEVHPQDEPLLIPVRDGQIASDLQDAIHEEILRSGGTGLGTFNPDTYLSISMKDPPIAVAGSFDVTLILDGHSYTTSWSFEPNSAGNTWRPLTFLLPDRLIHQASNPYKPFDTFSLRLTPNPEHLKRLPRGYEYLDHTLWLKDIPMVLPEP
ncbi:MAG: hypothetical protein KTR15_13620 [Phycisphaeraceae bacterium]|nr:hypothetical protein [Phycisphaeraceae bacterium]